MSRESELSALRLEQAKLRADQAKLEADQLRMQITKLQMEVDRLRNESSGTNRLALFSILRRLAEGFGWGLVVAATYLPLHALEPLARSFSGRNTQVEAGLRIAMLCTAVVSAGWLITGAQSRLRKRKIKTQRRRLRELERELAEKSAPAQKDGT